ncbi:type II toxin-antitoxin system RelE/ParE family toxin [Uliginosibacterium gangwonense]|uniref:type II toxin-antitoxin system RelE/ParE family toxin n=1 Tax=Uliginosibacterium gangwonense TaxID=392736 RepID=UPI000370389F|nr:type II toxin-antitoxin system RelE/ParE family toxin [Uliginosibacterium gangwonense]
MCAIGVHSQGMALFHFIETSIFTAQVKELLTDDEYRELQRRLIDNPETGDLMEGTGGARKVRHGARGKGKSGGVRAIYYYAKQDGQIFMLVIYPKSEQDNLSKAQRNALKSIIKELDDGS